MSDTGLPDDIRSFILQHIDSVAKLEALLLMHSHPSKNWSATNLAQRLYIPVNQTAMILAALLSAGLCAPAQSHPGHYVFSPATRTLADLVDQLAAHYAKHLLSITHLIHTRKTNSPQSFSDAFKFKKQEDE